MKEICFIIDSIKGSGGRERVISLLANEFVQENRVEILILDNCEESFYELDKRIKKIPLRSNGKIDMLKKLHRILKVNEEKIYITLSMRLLNLFVGIASINTKSKIIATEHCDYFTTPKLLRGMKRIFYKNFECVVTLTIKDRDIIKPWVKNCIQINNPCSFKSDIESSHENNIILNIGRLTEQKGQDMLIDAWKLIDRKNWKLKIVGEGELKGSFNKKISELSLDNSIEIIPPTKTIDKIYKSADFFVLSSRWEGLPMVLIEAMEFGLPCVSFDCETGPRQLIIDGKNGFLVEANNVEKLAEKINCLIEDKEKIKKMAIEAKLKANEFKIENIMPKWNELIEKIKEGKK
ncbi:glycosyltransferase family 4 protein [uncultured Clostridium sp.]|uniref:glycosyltransferase family 4 protein n=1 Tax=uncultured Clostridium sp. TaxID=59620 RepID=UPI00262D0202|nr:glycosyltransferase family 4 protein [uncultured Clostridium sp.]